MKKCPICEVSRTPDEHGRHSYCRPCNASRRRAYRAANPEKVRQKENSWRATRVEKTGASFKKWREKNLDREKARRAAQYAKNRDCELSKARKYKAGNKAILSAKAKEYLRENPEYNRYARSLRRAAEKQATPKWADRVAIRRIYAEAVSMTIESGVQHHADHIVPLQSKIVCGLHVPANLQVLPAPENLAKRNLSWPDMP